MTRTLRTAEQQTLAFRVILFHLAIQWLLLMCSTGRGSEGRGGEVRKMGREGNGGEGRGGEKNGKGGEGRG